MHWGMTRAAEETQRATLSDPTASQASSMREIGASIGK